MNLFKFKNTYNQLPSSFFSQAIPEKFPNGKLLRVNEDLFTELSNEKITSEDKEKLELIMNGQSQSEDLANIAMAYSGHQFGHFSPVLGDGRAYLVGEISDFEKKKFDLHLKGSGRTIFSRGGDGKSPLGPVVREYIISEAMHSLGIPTTRSLAIFATDQDVQREKVLKGGVLARTAKSHIRIGTFEFFASQEDLSSLQTLVDYTIDRHYPEILKQQDHNQKIIMLIESVARAQASMVANWMRVGFIHGVMNTDNMTITGETIDYGPCAFMDYYEQNKVYSSIDRHGRYAYNNQIKIAVWNLYRFISCLIPLIKADSEEGQLEYLQENTNHLEAIYRAENLKQMAKKFGIEKPVAMDEILIDDFLSYLESESLDFTNSFTLLRMNPKELKQTQKLDAFLKQWYKRLEGISNFKEVMKNNNPSIIPRNHHVEKAISNCYEGDFSFFDQLNLNLTTPYQDDKIEDDFTKPPEEDQVVKNTFCGT